MPEITKEDLFLFVGKGEKRYKELIAFGGSRISKNTLLKYKGELEREGKLKKKINKDGKIVYYVPEEYHRELEALERRRRLQSEVNGLIKNYGEEVVKKLVEEVDHLKRELMIKELERRPLPRIVLEKMVGEEARSFKNMFELVGTIEDLPPEMREVEVKTISEKEYIHSYRFHRGWKILKEDREKGLMIIGIYKELLRLYKENFEYDLLKWKERCKLTDDEWAIFGPFVRKMIEDDRSPCYIFNRLSLYNLTKTEEGRGIIRKTMGDEKARKIFEAVERLRREPSNGNFKSYLLCFEMWEKEITGRKRQKHSSEWLKRGV